MIYLDCLYYETSNPYLYHINSFINSKKNMKFLFLALLLIATILATATAQDAKPFDFREFLVDQTDHFLVFKTKNVNGELITSDSPIQRQITFTAQNNTLDLIGNSYYNNTALNNTISEVKPIAVKFDTTKNNTGSFFIGDEKVFDFAITSVNNLIYIAQGQYKGEKKTFQLVIPTPDRLVLTIVNADGEIEETLVSKKIPIAVEQTLWQKYGSFILMFGLMGLNLFVQSKTRNMNQDEPAPDSQLPELDVVGEKKEKKEKKAKSKKD